MPKKLSPLQKEYRKEVSRNDEHMRQLSGIEKISTTLLRKISSTLRILEDLDHDHIIQSILDEASLENSTENTINYIPPMISENAIRFVPGLQKYNDKILEICNEYSNEDTTNPPESKFSEAIQDSYDFIKKTPLLHKDLEGQ